MISISVAQRSKRRIHAIRIRSEARLSPGLRANGFGGLIILIIIYGTFDLTRLIMASTNLNNCRSASSVHTRTSTWPFRKTDYRSPGNRSKPSEMLGPCFYSGFWVRQICKFTYCTATILELSQSHLSLYQFLSFHVKKNNLICFSSVFKNRKLFGLFLLFFFSKHISNISVSCALVLIFGSLYIFRQRRRAATRTCDLQ